MGLGYSVGDFVALGQLAWKIYKACNDAPESFKNITQEVSSLHLVLKELEEIYSNTALSPAAQSHLKIVGDGCRSVLEDLQRCLDKYNSLGTKSKRTWDRLGWGSKNIAELRSRLMSNTGLLTAFLSTSQFKVQNRLDLFLQEFRDGMHEGSVVSTQTLDSLSTDERQTWRAIRKELEEVGISVAAFDANKDFIVNWFKTAINSGAFDEQVADDGSSSIFCEDDSGQSLDDPGHENVLSQPLENLEGYTKSVIISDSLRGLKSPPEVEIDPRLPSRIGKLMKWLSRYNEYLLKGARSEDELEIALKINTKDDGTTPLHHAVALRNEMMVRLLLDHGADIDEKDGDGYTALHWAVLNGDDKMVQCFFKNGADIDRKDGDGFVALHLAVMIGHKAVAQLLLEHGANINEENNLEEKPLHVAAGYGQEAMVLLLLKNGAKIDEKSAVGTALHSAAQWGCNRVVQLLVENGASINARNLNGDTVLHKAALSGNGTTVQLLLENGAKIDNKNYSGQTALHSAAGHGCKTVAQFLLENGAKTNEKDGYGWTALHGAAVCGHETVMPLLFEAGAKVNEKNREGYEALHLAAANGHTITVSLLLEKGARIDEKNDEGYTPLHLAVQSGEEKVVRLLLQNGANSNRKDSEGWTALHWAVESRRKGVVHILLENGVDINKIDGHGCTALAMAISHGRLELARMLRNAGGLE